MNRFSEPLQSLTVDVHQHLWPAPFLEALRARRTAPRLVGWELRLAGERAFAVAPADHDPDLRAELRTRFVASGR